MLWKREGEDHWRVCVKKLLSLQHLSLAQGLQEWWHKKSVKLCRPPGIPFGGNVPIEGGQ